VDHELPAIVGLPVDARHCRDILVLPCTARMRRIDECNYSGAEFNEGGVSYLEGLPRIHALNGLEHAFIIWRCTPAGKNMDGVVGEVSGVGVAAPSRAPKPLLQIEQLVQRRQQSGS
jgi:hypothetical protein